MQDSISQDLGDCSSSGYVILTNIIMHERAKLTRSGWGGWRGEKGFNLLYMGISQSHIRPPVSGGKVTNHDSPAL